MREQIAERERVLRVFLAEHADGLARACHQLAQAFARGGTLIALGEGAAATDAAHAAVEFMHPVIVGKPALPALAPVSDPTGESSLERLGRPGDAALVISHGSPDDLVVQRARQRGMLVISFSGQPGAVGPSEPEVHRFAVPSEDQAVVQEVQETAYHELWELVHVFLEQPALLEQACLTCGDVAVEAEVVALGAGAAVVERAGAREQVAIDLVEEVSVGDRLLCHAGVALERAPEREDPSGFLYPFLDGARGRDGSGAELEAVLEDVRRSVVDKGEDVIALRRALDLDGIERCAADVRERLDRGGRLVAFGNGGSSTDAQDAAADFAAAGRPAVALTNDVATLTAIGNDVGFDSVFARQLIPLAREADVALGISTSGSSPNVLAGLAEAHRRGTLTVGIAGCGGGALAELPWLDHLIAVGSDYVPRLQEAHATAYHLLVEAL